MLLIFSVPDFKLKKECALHGHFMWIIVLSYQGNIIWWLSKEEIFLKNQTYSIISMIKLSLEILTLFQWRKNVDIVVYYQRTTNSHREISRVIKIIDADYLYVPKSLDDLIKTCQNFHGEVQSQELIPIIWTSEYAVWWYIKRIRHRTNGN
jgi:hypothetical protein